MTPPPLATRLWTAATEEDTARLADCLAAAIRQDPALADLLVTLQGDLGAGKTTLVRYWLRALGVRGRIKSPSYALVEPYELRWDPARPAIAAWHMDLYRLDDPREWEDAGLRELSHAPGLKFVEWPQKAGPSMPTPDLDMQWQHHPDDTRTIVLRAYSPRAVALLDALAATARA
jgi:tRNA threonylcarbamoyladenosine biosynthesis protein TsaE